MSDCSTAACTLARCAPASQGAAIACAVAMIAVIGIGDLGRWQPEAADTVVPVCGQGEPAACTELAPPMLGTIGERRAITPLFVEPELTFKHGLAYRLAAGSAGGVQPTAPAVLQDRAIMPTVIASSGRTPVQTYEFADGGRVTVYRRYGRAAPAGDARPNSRSVWLAPPVGGGELD